MDWVREGKMIGEKDKSSISRVTSEMPGTARVGPVLKLRAEVKSWNSARLQYFGLHLAFLKVHISKKLKLQSEA